MNQELFLSPRECAKNAGIFLLIRLLLGGLVYFSLSALFPVPTDSMIGAVRIVKANVLVFIGVLAALFFLALFSLIVAFPLNNVLTSENKNLSKAAQYLRLVELLIFIAGIILLFIESSLFLPVLYIGLILYGAYIVMIGYLVISVNSFGWVSIMLIVGGTLGYMTIGLVNFSLPNLIGLSNSGAIAAIIGEYALALTLLGTALRTKVTDPKETITMILKEKKEATTAEIIDESTRVSAECKDRIPEALAALENEEIIAKKLSKEKKGYVWSLVS